jgi:hypothetical protein
MEHLMNKCPYDIKRLAKIMSEDDVREMIRFYFSRNLMDTSAENQIKVDIVLETDETFGLSTNDMLRIVSIWQHPSEGIITFVLNGGKELDFDDVDTSDLFNIMDYFDDYCLDWF